MNKQLSKFLTDLKLEQVPKAVVDKAKLALLDTIGVGLAGSASRAARISQEFVLTYPMMPATASIWGRKERTSILWAAFVNAAAAASLDADDGHRGACGHPGGVIIPAAMAACDRINASGKMLLESLIAGYEIGLRVGMVVNRLQEERFFGSGTWASFGAAAAAAKVFGLENNSCIDALGIVEINTPLCLIMSWIELRTPPEVKEGMSWAAVTGLAATLLAEKGMRGTFSLFNNDAGQIMVENLGIEYEILRTYLKQYTSCRWTHPAIDAVIQTIQAYSLKEKDIAEIAIRTHSKACNLDIARPKSIEDVQFSFPFLVATAIINGRIGPSEISEDRLHDPGVLALADRVSVKFDSGVQAAYPEKTKAQVDITTTTGKKYTVTQDGAQGDTNMPLNKDEILHKFGIYAGHIFTMDRVSQITNMVLEVEKLDKVSQLNELLRR